MKLILASRSAGRAEPLREHRVRVHADVVVVEPVNFLSVHERLVGGVEQHYAIFFHRQGAPFLQEGASRHQLLVAV